jgi:hypothetical protein
MSDMNGESSPQGNEWHAKPNWMHWLKLGYVDAWQGTALAHDFDPVTYTEPLNTNQRAVNTTILPPDVRVKYKAARQFFNNKEVMPVGEFAMWAHTQGWNIPFEMTQFVKTGYVTPIEALPQQAQKQTTATNEDFGILETAALAVLAYETAKAKATINLQNSPRVNQMLNNLVNLRSQITTPAEATPADKIQDGRAETKKLTARDKVRSTVTAFISIITPLAIAKYGNFDPMNAPNKKAFFSAMQLWAAENKHVKLSSENGLKDYCSDLVSFKAGRPKKENINYYTDLLK